MMEKMERLEKLEEKMKSFETCLNEIRNALLQGKTPSGIKERPKNSFYQLTPVEQEKIMSIMGHFNFEVVQSVMENLDWKWIGTSYGVPTVQELKDEAKRLLVDAATEKTKIATGGLCAVYESDGPDDPDPYIGLEFILEECEGFKKEDDDFTCGEDHDDDEDDE